MDQATQVFVFISAVFGAGTAVIAFIKGVLDLRQRLQRPRAASPVSAAPAKQSQARGAAPAPQGYPIYPPPGYPIYPTLPAPPARASAPPFWRRSLPYPRLTVAAIVTLMTWLALSAANGTLFAPQGAVPTSSNLLTVALSGIDFIAFCFAIYYVIRAGQKAARFKRWGWLIALFFPVYGWIVFGLFGPTAPKRVKVRERIPVA